MLTAKSYRGVLRKPLLIPVGLYEVCRHTFYDYPKTVFTSVTDKKMYEPLKLVLEKRLSHSIAISEVVGAVGTFTAITICKRYMGQYGVSDYISSVVGDPVGNYVFAVGSFLLSYIGLSKSAEGYSARQAFEDGLRMVRNFVPTALAIYIGEAPLIAGLIKAGFSADIAAPMVYLLDISITTGLSKKIGEKEITIR